MIPGIVAGQMQPAAVAEPFIIGSPTIGEPGVGYVFAPYVLNLAGPVTWSVAAGALPAGLALNPATGEIEGTPTALEVRSITLLATGPEGAVSGDFVIAIARARYWRLYITANNGDAYTSIQEVELRAEVGGADLTSPSTPTTQSSYYVPFNNPGARTVDNNITDYAYSVWVTNTGVPLPHWVRYDLGGALAVRQVAIWPQNYSGGPARAPKDFFVQASTDDATWANIAAFSGVTGWAEGTPKIITVF